MLVSTHIRRSHPLAWLRFLCPPGENIPNNIFQTDSIRPWILWIYLDNSRVSWDRPRISMDYLWFNQLEEGAFSKTCFVFLFAYCHF